MFQTSGPRLILKRFTLLWIFNMFTLIVAWCQREPVLTLRGASCGSEVPRHADHDGGIAGMRIMFGVLADCGRLSKGLIPVYDCCTNFIALLHLQCLDPLKLHAKYSNTLVVRQFGELENINALFVIFFDL